VHSLQKKQNYSNSMVYSIMWFLSGVVKWWRTIWYVLIIRCHFPIKLLVL